MNHPLTNVRAAAAFETATLENGLTVLVHTMPAFTGVHAVYATGFGSVDRSFSLAGKKIDLPAGIAHFLEHKMFENEEGDAFALYAKTGASANAYTGFDKTCYVFTASSAVPENLDILLSFVSHPYFTEKTVQKEQGIIGQEIKMYEDAPDWRLMFAVYECLYHAHPLREDIAGTVESIAAITPELLYACTDAFYRPQNMVLAVAGNVTLQTVLDACARAQMPVKTQPVERIVTEEPAGVFRAYQECSMAIAKPMLGVGFKETPLTGDTLKGEIICDMLTELICGSMTPLYRKLYDEGLVSPGFSGEFISLPGATCMMFGGETSQPEKVRALLLDEIKRIKQEGISTELFTLCKNMMYGEMVQDLENIEDVAAGMAGAFFKNRTPADEITALAALTAEEVNAALQNMLCETASATVIIRPAQSTQSKEE
ncbi:MAG: pitrilysin family protein [Ruthenibacterium sp.]